MEPLERALNRLRRAIEFADDDLLRMLFADTFLRQLPVPQLREILAGLRREHGSCTAFEIREKESQTSAQVRLRFESDCRLDGQLAIESDPPHRITFLRFGLPRFEADSWDEIEAELRRLPGRTSFELRDLTGDRPLARWEAEQAVGVGSTSKLMILAPLLSDLASGHRRWDEVLVLEERDLSLPSGILQDWPPGSPLTLTTLVALLLSYSDNTAADLLLRVLGRERVEEFARTHGIGAPEANRPFYSTRGLFNLLNGPESARGEYLAAGEDLRRELLATAERRGPGPWPGDELPWPEGFDWFLSASDVIRLLGQIRRELEKSEIARRLFGMNDGGLSSDEWSFAGFKGGSSPGRLALATLLQDAEGRWVAACFACNATPATLNVEKCSQLTKRATDLALDSG